MVAWGDLSLSTEKYYSIVFVLRSVAVVYKSCRNSEMSLKAKEIEDSILYIINTVKETSKEHRTVLSIKFKLQI